MNKKLISKKIVENQIEDDYWYYNGYDDDDYECECYVCAVDWDWYSDWIESRKRRIEWLLDEEDCLMNTAKIIKK